MRTSSEKPKDEIDEMISSMKEVEEFYAKTPYEIVGFSGKKGSGKSTAASYLVADHGYKNKPLAAPLKDMLAQLFIYHLGMDAQEVRAALHGGSKEREIKAIGVSARELMQTLGTEWGKNAVHPDLWVNIMRKKISQEKGPVVVDDIRFENEAEMVRSLGGVVIEIDRKFDRPKDEHSSEVLDFTPDFIVYNAGSVKSLKQAVHRIVFGQ